VNSALSSWLMAATSGFCASLSSAPRLLNVLNVTSSSLACSGSSAARAAASSCKACIDGRVKAMDAAEAQGERYLDASEEGGVLEDCVASGGKEGLGLRFNRLEVGGGHDGGPSAVDAFDGAEGVAGGAVGFHCVGEGGGGGGGRDGCEVVVEVGDCLGDCGEEVGGVDGGEGRHAAVGAGPGGEEGVGRG